MPDKAAVPCYVSFRTPRGNWQHNTLAASLFEGALKAIRWFNEWQGPRPRPESVLNVTGGWSGAAKEYRVRAGRVIESFGLNPHDWLDS